MKQRIMWGVAAATGLAALTLTTTSRTAPETVDVGHGGGRPTTTTTPASTSTTAPLRTEPIAFHDRTGTFTLLIQTAGGQPDTGQYTFTVVGKASYDATATTTAGPRSVRVIGTDQTATAIDDTTSAVITTTVRIAGKIRPASNYARLTIWVGPAGQMGCADTSARTEADSDADDIDEKQLVDNCANKGVTRYRFRTGLASEAQAGATTARVMRMFSQQDWKALYKTLPPSATSRITETEFSNGMGSSIQGTLRDVRNEGPGLLKQAEGTTAWLQTIRFTINPTAGPPTTYTTTIMLTFEGGEWWFVTTTTPQPL